MTLKDFARLARSARSQATSRHASHLGEPMAVGPAEPPPQARTGARRPALQAWKNRISLTSSELPWIALVLGVVVIAGLYVRW
jgi:hypothetical protein